MIVKPRGSPCTSSILQEGLVRARACTGACMYVYEELLPPTSISNIVLIDDTLYTSIYGFKC